MKFAFLLGGIALGAVLLFLAYAQDSVMMRICFGFLAGASVYAGAHKKVDLNDAS